MSTDIRDQMARAICESTSAGRLFPWETLSVNERTPWRRMADAALAAQRDAGIIRTVDELDALPLFSVVREILVMPSGEDMGYVWERWNGFTPQWMKMGLPPERSSPSAHVRLPARLLRHPDWDTQR